MTTAKKPPPLSLSLSDLPALKAPLHGGTFIGLTTVPDGTHHAVVLLPDKPPKRLPWKQACAWAKKLKATLPSRPVAALIFANARDLVEPSWHWTSEADGPSDAWYCCFGDGFQSCNLQSCEGGAVAVRLIPLNP
jgi:hypothetical protein